MATKEEGKVMADIKKIHGVRIVSPEDRWCVHSYYSLCPYAPDGSGRMIYSAANLDTGKSQIYVQSADGTILKTFGNIQVEASFYHTGTWCTWSPDSKAVYYRSGTQMLPQIVRHDIETGEEIIVNGDMESAPTSGEPIISGYLGMLYAAGYANGEYHPEQSPFVFEERDSHGLFCHYVSQKQSELLLSVSQLLDIHPMKKHILNEEKLLKERLGNNEKLTLMAYCVRWNSKGDRCLFYFGNHCVDKRRGEPRLSYLFTADREFKEIHYVLDLSKGGVHWSFHPDGIHLIGYARDPMDESKTCLCMVKYDGTGFRKISSHNSGGHPSISPTDYNLLVTDENNKNPGRVVFIDLSTDTEIGSYVLPRRIGDNEPKGRNPFRVCHHPVFHPSGRKVLCNILPGRYSMLCELDVPERS